MPRKKKPKPLAITQQITPLQCPQCLSPLHARWTTRPRQPVELLCPKCTWKHKLIPTTDVVNDIPGPSQ